MGERVTAHPPSFSEREETTNRLVGATLARSLGAVGAAAVVAVSCSHHATPAEHVVAGTYAVHGDYEGSGANATPGAACRASVVGYQDIGLGTSVTVRDDASRLLARTALGRGAFVVRSGLRDDCVYRFRVRVPDRAAYVFEVGSRGGVRFTRTDLERAHWQAELTIGNYTLGT